MSEPRSEVFEVRSDGSLVLALHVQPGAARSAVVGRHGDALKVRVAAPPEAGKANAAVLRLLVSELGVRPADLELVGGAGARRKQVRVRGLDPAELRRRLAGRL